MLYLTAICLYVIEVIFFWKLPTILRDAKKTLSITLKLTVWNLNLGKQRYNTFKHTHK